MRAVNKSGGWKLLAVGAASLLLASGCSRLEDANEGKGYAGKADTPAYSGKGGQYSAGGWDSGSKDSWENALKNRANGQNEYLRTPAREN